MTLIVELTPNEEARLQEAARRQRVEPSELIHTLISNYLPQVDTSSEQVFDTTNKPVRDTELAARVRNLRGSLVHLSVGTEDLHRERQSDKSGEEQFVHRSES